VSAAALAALLSERQPCVVLTGAGVSTESGIPDFRSPTGIWATVDPLEVASIQAFRRDPEVAEALTAARVDQLAVPTLAPGETLADLRADTYDVEAMALRGMAFERLDQLAMEHLLGAR